MKKGASTREKIKGHYTLFAEIWKAFEKIANHAIKIGASVWIEWPRGCQYWNNKQRLAGRGHRSQIAR